MYLFSNEEIITISVYLIWVNQNTGEYEADALPPSCLHTHKDWEMRIIFFVWGINFMQLCNLVDLS